jgi:hypothetical protein
MSYCLQVSAEGHKGESPGWQRVEAFSYQIEAVLHRIIKNSSDLSSGPLINIAAFIDILKKAILETMFEMVVYFHIPRKKCLSLSLFKAAEAAHIDEGPISGFEIKSIEKIKHSKWRRFRNIKSSDLPAGTPFDLNSHLEHHDLSTDDDSVVMFGSSDVEDDKLYDDESDEDNHISENLQAASGIENLDATQLFALQLISSSIDGILNGGDPVDQIMAIVKKGSVNEIFNGNKIKDKDNTDYSSGQLSQFLSQELTQVQTKLVKCQAKLELFELLQVLDCTDFYILQNTLLVVRL